MTQPPEGFPLHSNTLDPNTLSSLIKEVDLLIAGIDISRHANSELNRQTEGVEILSGEALDQAIEDLHSQTAEDIRASGRIDELLALKSSLEKALESSIE